MDDKKNIKDLSSEQILEREILLDNLKTEMAALEYDIKHIDEHNKKVRKLRQTKICLCFLRRIAPYVATAGFTFGLFVLLKATPFICDNVRSNLKVKKELDSYGNIKLVTQYNDFEDTNGKISYVGKWTKEDEFYSRETKIYSIRKIDEDMVEAIVNNFEEMSLEDILGSPIDEVKEIRNVITEEELNQDEYIEALCYSEVENDYIMTRETLGSNIGMTIVWLLATAFCEIIPFCYRDSGISKFNFDSAIHNINVAYPSVKKEELVKRLEIKQNNYKLLTR